MPEKWLATTTGVADFWDHDLKLIDGRYVDTNDAEDEHLWGSSDDVNPATVIGFLNMLYPALLDIGDQLHSGRDMRYATWQDRTFEAEHPSADCSGRECGGHRARPSWQTYPRRQDGDQGERKRDGMGDHQSRRPLLGSCSRSSDPGSSAGMNSLRAVFPAWNVGPGEQPGVAEGSREHGRLHPSVVRLE